MMLGETLPDLYEYKGIFDYYCDEAEFRKRNFLKSISGAA
jgi:hypothetical protein